MATLVTGGAGYIGSHTVVALHEAGREPVIVDDFSNASHRVIDALRRLTVKDLAVVEGDAGDQDLLARILSRHAIDSVVHFAARKSVSESLADPLGYYRSNIGATIALAGAGIAAGVKRIVFSSSAVVYGAASELPVSEDAPTAPESPYGVTKLTGERILADAAAVSPTTAVMLRYFNPVGAHPSGLLGEDPRGEPGNLAPRIMQVASGARRRLEVHGADYATVDGTAVRDYVHVTDLADGHVAALDVALEPLTDKRSRVYNLGTGAGTTVLQAIAAAAAVTGSEIPYVITGRRSGDVAASWADCGRARSELGWQARRSLQQMLADQWNFVRRRQSG
ncbi:MAG: UDP-glucose 4-epimerase GalE [Acidimicrobiaceae bacterium]|nr:UDP-glucose 4-epimerase GalE [Acidimicrobiaceae bacterium]